MKSTRYLHRLFQVRFGLGLVAALALAGCGGSGGGPGAPVPVTVGGTVSGLTGGGLVLQSTGATDLAVNANGSFTLTAPYLSGTSYGVTVKTQPSVPAQTCTVLNGSGTVATNNVNNIAVSCELNTIGFAYVANQGGSDVSNFGNVSVFGIMSTGALEARGAVASGDGVTAPGPTSVAVNPAGTFVYVANNGIKSTTTNGSVSAYRVNTSTGALTPISGSPFPAGLHSNAVTVDPTGRFVYVTNSGDGLTNGTLSAYTVNPGTGALTAAGNPVATGLNPSTVTVGASGRFVYVGNTGSASVSAYNINATTGVLTELAGSPYATGEAPLSAPVSISIDPSGRFGYVANNNSANISAFTIDANGVLTTLGAASGAGVYPLAVTVDAAGKFAYVTNAGPADDPNAPSKTFSHSELSVYEIASGALSAAPKGVLATGALPTSVNIDPSGRFVYVTSLANGNGNVLAYNINPANGLLTAMVGGQFSAGSGAYAMTTTRKP